MAARMALFAVACAQPGLDIPVVAYVRAQYTVAPDSYTATIMVSS